VVALQILIPEPFYIAKKKKKITHAFEYRPFGKCKPTNIQREKRIYYQLFCTNASFVLEYSHQIPGSFSVFIDSW